MEIDTVETRSEALSLPPAQLRRLERTGADEFTRALIRFAYADDLRADKTPTHAVRRYFRNAWIVANYPSVGLPAGFKPERARFLGKDVKTFAPLLRLQCALRRDFEELLAALPDERARQHRRELAEEFEQLRSSKRAEDQARAKEVRQQLAGYDMPREWERRTGQLARTVPVTPPSVTARINARLPRLRFYPSGGLSADYESDLATLLYYGLALALSRGVLSRLARCDHCGRPVLRLVLRYEPDEGVFCSIEGTKCKDTFHNNRRQKERRALAMRRYRNKRRMQPGEQIVPLSGRQPSEPRRARADS